MFIVPTTNSAYAAYDVLCGYGGASTIAVKDIDFIMAHPPNRLIAVMPLRAMAAADDTEAVKYMLNVPARILYEYVASDTLSLELCHKYSSSYRHECRMNRINAERGKKAVVYDGQVTIQLPSADEADCRRVTWKRLPPPAHAKQKRTND